MRFSNSFSLVELMTVIAIIAILSVIALPMYTKSRCKTQWGEVPGCLSNVSLHLENYRASHGHYPSASGEIPACLGLVSGDCSEYYSLKLWANATDYYIQAADMRKKLPCSGAPGDDEWVLTNTSPKFFHTKNSVQPTQVDTMPVKPG